MDATAAPQIHFAQTDRPTRSCRSVTQAHMTGGSPPPPNSRHLPWNRSAYRGRGGRPWGHPRRGAPSPQAIHRRFRSNHRSGPQQPPAGRGNLPARYNQPWHSRAGPHSPRRQNDGNWQRSQYKVPYNGLQGPPPLNGQRRLSGSPPLRKHGHGNQGNSSYAGRDRSDMPPSSSAKCRPYTPPRGFGGPHDSSRACPPQISSHLQGRSRLPVPIPMRPCDKSHLGRNQPPGGRAPRPQGPLPQRPGGNHYAGGNQHSGGRMSGHLFNSPRLLQKHDSAGNVPNNLGRTAPGLASQPPARHLSRTMQRPSSPYRAMPRASHQTNSYARGKTEGAKTRPASPRFSHPRGPPRHGPGASAPVKSFLPSATGKSIPANVMLRKSSVSTSVPKITAGKVELPLIATVNGTDSDGPSKAEFSNRTLLNSSDLMKDEALEESPSKDSLATAVTESKRPKTSILENPHEAVSAKGASSEKDLSNGLAEAAVEKHAPKTTEPPEETIVGEAFSSVVKSTAAPDGTDAPSDTQFTAETSRKEKCSPHRSTPHLSPARLLSSLHPPKSLPSSPLATLPSSVGLKTEITQSKCSPSPRLRSSPVPKPPSSKPYMRSVTRIALPVTQSSPNKAYLEQKADPPVSKSPRSSPPQSPSFSSTKAPDLVGAIAEVETRIAALRKSIAAKKAKILNGSALESSVREENGVVNIVCKPAPDDLPVDECKAAVEKIAEAIARSAEQMKEPEDTGIDYVSPITIDLARILRSNRANARAAADVFRPLCRDPEKGLSFQATRQFSIPSAVNDKIVDKVRDTIQSHRAKAVQRKKSLAKEYNAMNDTWRRRLKAVRDKRSKEKREASRDRDRYLVVHTKGASALLTCKTSSGRTSTKVLPGVTAGGALNNMAEIDSMLADIEHAGGTPGSHHIWGKTLADVPEQEPDCAPFDSGNLLMDDPIGELHAARCENPWTREEKLIFLDKYLLHQKNFRKISTFLEHKSTNDCVRFYFDHKLQYDLKQLLRDSTSMKRKGTRGVHLMNLVGLPLTRRAMHMYSFDSNETPGSPAPDNELAQQIGEPTAKHVISPGRKLDQHPARGKDFSVMGINGPSTSELELNAEQRITFCEALKEYGTNWKALLRTTGFFGKDVTKLEDYFHRNKKQFNFLVYVQKYEHKSARGIGDKLDSEAPSPELTSKSVGATQKPTQKVNDSVPVSKSVRSTSMNGALSSSFRKPSMPEASETSPQASGFEACEKPRKATWTAQEMEEFDRHFHSYGKDFKKIASLMDKKTPEQVKGYWKMKIRQERESSGKSSRRRHRHRSSADGSPRDSTAGTAGSSARRPERENRKRAAGEAMLRDQREGHEKRERLSHISSKSGRNGGKTQVEGPEDVEQESRGSARRSEGASPETEKFAEPGRPPLRSKPAADGGSGAASPSHRSEREATRQS